ncbi:hypothetical protein IscW_ISCW018685 [Ixodes scapularis]|uniref:Uncharacterized protein n=1 Tax=Ixodes scapularis TaxID=6945 RepID=B7PLF3_IXOSC|nr:hypothetical protein IscW_ISCW018685 [Ixodes scapularis]|eukprot:XP_002434601.1 hypothetical protein IscW_ISCW018685 [Ixodes scapularis]
MATGTLIRSRLGDSGLDTRCGRWASYTVTRTRQASSSSRQPLRAEEQRSVSGHAGRPTKPVSSDRSEATLRCPRVAPAVPWERLPQRALARDRQTALHAKEEH